jgi:hypothetical protein
LKVENGVKDNASFEAQGKKTLSCRRFAEKKTAKRLTTEFTEGTESERDERELRLAREDFGAWLTSIHGMQG